MGFYLTYWLMGIILLPGIILAIIAQVKVNSAYSSMSQVLSKKGKTAAEVAREILDKNGLNNIEITTTPQTLGDHYDPKKKKIALSPGVYNSTSLAALGVATHEVGHALQYKNNHFFTKLRAFLVPVINFCSALLWPLVIIGILFNVFGAIDSVVGDVFLWCGVAFFGMSVIFSLVTLPSEFDASKRALKILGTDGYLEADEVAGAKRVLSAAAMTYVASLLVSILNFLRFIFTVLLLRER